MADSGQTVIAAERWLHEVTAALAADRLRAS
jgi:hypothetical protein